MNRIAQMSKRASMKNKCQLQRTQVYWLVLRRLHSNTFSLSFFMPSLFYPPLSPSSLPLSLSLLPLFFSHDCALNLGMGPSTILPVALHALDVHLHSPPHPITNLA